MTCYTVMNGVCHFHGPLDSPHPMCTIGYLVDPRLSPTFTAVTTRTRRSPLLTVSPLLGVSQLPVSFEVLGVSHVPPSPVIPTVVFTTPSVNPLVALDPGLYHHKIHYDVSKGSNDVRISRPYGPSIPITEEQKRSLVVEGTLHRRFRVVVDHPGLTSTIDIEGSLTVEDLFEELHSHFHQRVRPGEMSNLKKDMNLFQVAVDTQVKRCAAALDGHAEWDRGMKRVDILGKECKFRGIYLDTSYISDRLTFYVVFGR